MIDEGELRRRYPDIPWDQPVLITVERMYHVCRYCTAMQGVRAVDLDSLPFVFDSRAECLDHIDQAHHE